MPAVLGAPATVPPQVHAWSKGLPAVNPGVHAARARYGLEVTFGLDSSDPLILAAAGAGGFYVSTLAQQLLDAKVITAEEFGAVEMICKQAESHWRAALVEIGALPAPDEWRTDGDTQTEG